MGRSFESVVTELADFAGDERDLAAPLLELIPVTGASISTLGEHLGSETIAATDTLVARIDELQFDLGEGPCWDAVSSLRPVLEPDMQRHSLARWPAFSEAIQDEGVGAVFAFPMAIGTLRVGAVDLYNRTAGALNPEQVKRAAELTTVVTRYVLRRALRLAGDTVDHGDTHSRRIVHQAEGFVVAQLGISSEDAHLLLQGQAFAEGRRMSELAQDIVDYRFRFFVNNDGIEAGS